MITRHDFSAKGIEEEELQSSDLLPLLQSMKYMKAQYVHQPDEASYFYEALRSELSALKVQTAPRNHNQTR